MTRKERKAYRSIDSEKIRELHSQGSTDTQIAKIMNENNRSIRSARLRMNLPSNKYKFTCECGNSSEARVSAAKFCPACRLDKDALFWARKNARSSLQELAKVNLKMAREVAEELKLEDPVTFKAMGDLTEILSGSQSA